MADKDQKTEQPTQRRMKKAREEGSLPPGLQVGSFSSSSRGLDKDSAISPAKCRKTE
jgi:hypothetical protein